MCDTLFLGEKKVVFLLHCKITNSNSCFLFLLFLGTYIYEILTDNYFSPVRVFRQLVVRFNKELTKHVKYMYQFFTK